MTNAEKVAKLTRQQIMALLHKTVTLQELMDAEHTDLLRAVLERHGEAELEAMIIEPFDLPEGYVTTLWAGMTIGISPEGRVSS